MAISSNEVAREKRERWGRERERKEKNEDRHKTELKSASRLIGSGNLVCDLPSLSFSFSLSLPFSLSLCLPSFFTFLEWIISIQLLEHNFFILNFPDRLLVQREEGEEEEGEEVSPWSEAERLIFRGSILRKSLDGWENCESKRTMLKIRLLFQEKIFSQKYHWKKSRKREKREGESGKKRGKSGQRDFQGEPSHCDVTRSLKSFESSLLSSLFLSEFFPSLSFIKKLVSMMMPPQKTTRSTHFLPSPPPLRPPSLSLYGIITDPDCFAQGTKRERERERRTSRPWTLSWTWSKGNEKEREKMREWNQREREREASQKEAKTAVIITSTTSRVSFSLWYFLVERDFESQFVEWEKCECEPRQLLVTNREWERMKCDTRQRERKAVCKRFDH